MINGVWINLVLLLYNLEGINRRGRSTASGQTTCSVLLQEQEGGSLLCIFSVGTHTPPLAVVLKALLCVCEWCESYSDTA